MSTYIFVDGAYLRLAHEQNVFRWFGVPPKIALAKAIRHFVRLGGEPDSLQVPVVYAGTGETQAFYYDCLDEEPKNDEVAEQFKKRQQEQDERLRELRDLNNCHIRLGVLKGKRRRQQKEVDVLMAVDMMAHAARGNMDKAVLVAGDLDFRPAVEALVQMGIVVHVIADMKVAKELTWASSSFSELTFRDFFGYTDLAEQRNYPLPLARDYFSSVDKRDVLRKGIMKGDNCNLYRLDHGYGLHFPNCTFHGTYKSIVFEHEKVERIELLLEIEYEPVRWLST